MKTRPRRLPTETLRLVRPAHIEDAIVSFDGAIHNFGDSRDYDVVLPSGERLPPKAIFGLALEQVIGRSATPNDFTAGLRTVCFEAIGEAGYRIVRKGAEVPTDEDEEDETSWAEGSKRRIEHLRRERVRGLARMKKQQFAAEHGHLSGERCGLIPSRQLGPLGDACIEVHHSAEAIAAMTSASRTRLSDLQCLCANCHRIVHRETLG